MTDIQISAYLYNVQLTKLVSSADVLLQHVYNLLSPQKNKELRDCIFTWLCDKQEVDNCLANKRKKSVDSDLSSSETFDSENSQEFSDDSYIKSDIGNALADDPYVEIDDKSSSMCNKNSSMMEIATNPNTVNFNRDSVSESSLNNSSFKFCRYCSNETNECPPTSTLPVSEQIEQLRTIQEPLLRNCQDITKFTRHRDLEKNPQLKQLFALQEILELIDTSVEMKSDPRMMNRKILDLTSTDFFAYSTVCNILKTLTAFEIRYFFVVFIQKIVDLRESSYPLDKLILQLDNDIVDKEVRLHHLNKNYEKLKDACLSLSKKTGIKLGSSRGPQLDDLCRILTKSHLTEPTGENSQLLPSNIFSNKTSRSPTTLLNVPSKSLCISRQGRKLVFHHNKQS